MSEIREYADKLFNETQTLRAQLAESKKNTASWRRQEVDMFNRYQAFRKHMFWLLLGLSVVHYSWIVYLMWEAGKFV